MDWLMNFSDDHVIRDEVVFSDLMQLPDAAQRIDWLETRHHFRLPLPSMRAAVAAGNTCAVVQLTNEGRVLPVDRNLAAIMAASQGQVEVIKELMVHGVVPFPGLVMAAIHGGQLGAAVWLEELVGGAEAVRGFMRPGLYGTAIKGGAGLELLRFLQARGCPWGPGDFVAAVRAGSEQLLEWCVQHGCPMQVRAAAPARGWDLVLKPRGIGGKQCCGQLGSSSVLRLPHTEVCVVYTEVCVGFCSRALGFR